MVGVRIGRGEGLAVLRADVGRRDTEAEAQFATVRGEDRVMGPVGDSAGNRIGLPLGAGPRPPRASTSYGASTPPATW
ncbi:hypothetical protein SANTM175S_07587 [Streptomyces antimycoticus]